MMEQGYSMLECFPFDSSPEVAYDEWGYPRYDRAADARVLRETFAKFFSDGVFPSPGSALAISKGKGLSVDIAPGAAVLNGAMGGVYDAPLNVALDSEPPKGKVCYGIMLRYDNRRTHRGLFVRVAKSEPGPSPTPPEPESGPDIKELRLGHVTVPSGAADLSGAVVANEKGLACCPYAAPFEKVDLSEVVADMKSQAAEELAKYEAHVDRYYGLVASALDGTAAGHLQSQIDGISASGLADGVTINATAGGRMEVKDGSITVEKLGPDVASYIQSVMKPKPGRDIGAYSWEELVEMANDPSIPSENLSYLVGQSRPIQLQGYGIFDFMLIGIGHDAPASGSSKLLTFQSVDIVVNHRMNPTTATAGGWASCEMRQFLNDELAAKMPSNVRNLVKQAKKPYCATKGTAPQTASDRLWIASETEVFGKSDYGSDGRQYEYWSKNDSNQARIKRLAGTANYWWTRSVRDPSHFCGVSSDGSANYRDASYSYGCVPCFCI